MNECGQDVSMHWEAQLTEGVHTLMYKYYKT